ncbi:MAG: glutathione S-transferase N-terminal domain-containing protein [Rhodospirillaceae bacterium]|nr:glutathione S-transferase N-terminal domain-containing protein [Rhodospirillaceae bacterium]
MKLHYSPTSPYVRKVLVSAIELGISASIELLPTNVWDPNTNIASHNPLGKVPALMTEGSEILYDSPVIVDYLDSLNPDLELIPASGRARWNALRRQALADGILDAAILRLLEEKRPDGERSDGWIARQKGVINRALAQFESEADGFGLDINIGTIATGVALGYLDFRFAGDNWRADNPALADWFDIFCDRPSMVETTPKDPT